MSNMPWLRLYSDIVDNEKVRLLAFEDRWHFVAILCLKQQGILESNPELLNRKIAVKLGLQLSELDNVKKRLLEVELIDEFFQPIGWDKKQYPSDSSSERTRKYREKLKNKSSDNNETSQERHGDALDTDTDTDTETTIDTNVSIVGNDESLTDQIAKDDQIPACPHQEIISLYAKHLPMGIQPREWDGARAAALKTRWREKKKRQSLEWWDSFFEHISKSKFLTGKSTFKDGSTFEIQLPWILKAENFKKIIEGVYHKP